jgi:uridine kinase
MVVAIAGPTCSGKTSLATLIGQRLGQGRCAVVRQDGFYRDLSHLPEPERALRNFDAPTAIEWRALVRAVATLRAGQPVEVPTYDFSRHCRTGETQTVRPAPIVIVEGTLILHWQSLRRLADLRVYVDLDMQVCRARRIERDQRERARSRDSVLCQWEATVLPMHRRYVLPCRGHADLIVPGDDLEASAEAVIDAIARQTETGP